MDDALAQEAIPMDGVFDEGGGGRERAGRSVDAQSTYCKPHIP